MFFWYNFFNIFAKHYKIYEYMKFTALKLMALAATLTLSSCGNGGKDIVNVIPEPNYVKLLGGNTKADDGIVEKINDPKLGEEEYAIKIRKGKATVKASSLRGFLYAEQTLNQLRDSEGNWPDVIIKDKPRFVYRGMHLDCARHFFSIDEVKKYIDMMAVHKMNKFHWHLTEDQGWRIEIKKYPRLIEVGAWRKGEKLIRPESQPAPDRDETLYGGYYTQDELKEIVAYAAERGIDVIPELDLPGHMMAALASYPELGCEGFPSCEVWPRVGVSPDVLCAGNEKTFEFLEGVLDEIMEIFPYEYIHIGGDECPKAHWAKCPRCQAKIAELGLKADENFSAEHYLQSYVTKRIEKYLNDHGRSIIGWDEILEGELSPNATVMSWRGSAGGQKAAAMGHDAIMTPNTHFYFDYCQSQDHATEPESIGGYLPVSKVYEFEPFTPEMTEEEKGHILGIQANLWTEYIPTPEHLEYMLLPRMSALSEVQWCAPERRDADRFFRDMNRMRGLYEKMGYNYAKHIFETPTTNGAE